MRLKIKLLSDTTFGRGDGVAGMIDSEVEHDAKTGIPFVKGRTIKGILVESCADILFALQHSNSPLLKTYEQSARKLFGRPGSTIGDTGCLHISSAQLDDDLQTRIKRSSYSPSQILDALTTIRYQTAISTETDRPEDGSLRAIRAVLRKTIFYSEIITHDPLSPSDLELLAACAAGMRRAGQSRSRGRGRIEVTLIGDDNIDYLAHFTQHIQGA